MSLDRDLRDALEPLAGDPVADAMSVLAALPAPGAPPTDGESRPKPGRKHQDPNQGGARPRLPWWWMGGGLLLGLILGVGAGAWSRGTPKDANPPAASQGEAKPASIKDPKAAEKPDDKSQNVAGPGTGAPASSVVPDMRKPMPNEPAQLMLMAFGKLVVDEPGLGRQDLEPGAFMVLPGTQFETAGGTAGIYVYANDLRVRLDRTTTALVEPTLLTLTRGRLWLSNFEHAASVHVRTDFGEIEADAAAMIVDRGADAMSVICLEGNCVVHTRAGEVLRLGALQQIEVARRGQVGEVQKVPFAGAVTSWMTRMILLQTDDRELRDRIAEMWDAYVQGDHRDAAERELRRLGAPIVTWLLKSFDQVAADAVLARRTAHLIADVADYGAAEKLLALLGSEDAETRVLVFEALVRITGGGFGDASLWRSGAAADRAAAIDQWRMQLR